jgi:predicted ribosomally synthesized six-cysteine peptide SCIFF
MSEKTKNTHVKTILAGAPLRPAADADCDRCQVSCQSACKTSCTVGNQACPVKR